MPLDSHLYLVSQGWGGKGTGLRQGAISRPLAIPQKKSLAGLGKDRDEAFPFWDHLFSAASKSIQIKCLSDDDEEGNGISTNSSSIKCTSTGILSNRRPIKGTPATSGTNTPEITVPESQSYRLGLLATAKRDAAKHALYSNFFRGPVLGPDTIIEEKRPVALVDPIAATISVQETIEIQTADENMRVDLEVSKSLTTKRKSRETKESGVGDEEVKRERKRRRKEEKEKEAEKHATGKRHKKEKHRRKTMYTEDNSCTSAMSSPPPISQKDQKIEDVDVIVENRFSGNETDHESQADRKLRKKEEKKRLKRLEKTQAKDAKKICGSKSLRTKSSETLEEICSANAPEVIDEHKKRKKRKR